MKNKINKGLLLLIMTIVSFAVFCVKSPVNAKAESESSLIGITSNNKSEQTESNLYHGYNIENVEPFFNYLVGLGYDLEDKNTQDYILDNLEQFYNDALSKGIITYIQDDYLQESLPNSPIEVEPFWTGGDTYKKNSNSTHYKLTMKAVNILNGLFPSFFNIAYDDNNNEYYNTIARYSDYPDAEKEKYNLPQDCHFYYPPTGKNIDGKADIYNADGSINTPYTAKGRFIYHYYNAKTSYINGDFEEAKRQLGRSMHYLADLCTPVHTGYTGWFDSANWIFGHTNFENYAKQHHDLANFTPSYTYLNLQNYNLNDIANVVAWNSFNYFQQNCDWNLFWCSTDESKIEMYLKETAHTITTIMFKFMLDVEQLKYNVITPADYGYEGQYFFYNKTASVTVNNNFTFSTTRLRCGYIENECLVLSAYRENAGVAFLEYNFNKKIKSINFDISLWSGNENLGVNSSFSSINRWETGKHEPTIKVKRKIVELCKENNIDLESK